MQLHVARLCLDCEEIHVARTCPRCTSESFALLSRWVPAPERRATPRPHTGGEASEAYRQLLETPEDKPSSRRWLTSGAVLAAIGIGGWVLRRRSGKSDRDDLTGE